MRPQQLMDDPDILGLVDPCQDDGEITRNPVRP